MSVGNPEQQLLRLTTGIVAAHVSRNRLLAEELPELIRSVYAALRNVGTPALPAAVQLKPAVPVKKSVFPGHIVCLEDGMALKMLKRHLRANQGTTPAAYRERWRLPDSYPMVAPNHVEYRSSLAKEIGLGGRPAKPKGLSAINCSN